MYNFDFDLTEVFGVASLLIVFFAVVVLLGVIIVWVFSSLGLMNLAKKKNIPNPWLAFLPVGSSYLIGKLGFEVYQEESKKNPTLTWVTLGIAAGIILFGDESFSGILSIALLVFHSIAYYNIFKALSKNYVVFTVFTVLSDSLLGGVFLYSMRNTIEDKQEEDIKEETKEAEIVKEEKKEEIKKEEKVRPSFCSICGNKLNKTAKFCSNCGQKIE